MPPDSDDVTPGIITQDSYHIARDEAARQLRECDLDRQVKRCGAKWADIKDQKAVELLFFGRPVYVLPEEGVVVDVDCDELPLWDQITVLHHLAWNRSVQGVPEDLISFREIPDGSFFHAAFRQQVCQRLARLFGDDPKALLRAGEAAGGVPAELGDASVVLPAFGLVPLTCVIWAGDEDFPPEGNILFRSDISARLPTEDVAVIGSLAVSRLEQALKKSG